MADSPLVEILQLPLFSGKVASFAWLNVSTVVKVMIDRVVHRGLSMSQ